MQTHTFIRAFLATALFLFFPALLSAQVSLPDLVPSGLSGPNPVAANSTISINYHCTNNGASISSNLFWNDGVYLSPSGTFDRSTATHIDQVGQATYLPYYTFNAGETRHETTSVSIPAVPAGTYYLYVVADDSNDVGESNEGNNVVRFGPFSLSNDGPDLIVTSVSGPAKAAGSSSINIDYTIKNAGNAAFSPKSYIYIYFYLSPDTIGNDDNDQLLTLSFLDTTIDAGGTVSGTVNTFVPQVSGYYYILANVFEFSIPETNPDNNWTHSAVPIGIDVRRADLIVRNLKVGGDAATGKNVQFSYTVKNIGDTSVTASSWMDGVYLLNDSVFVDAAWAAFVVHNQQIPAGDSIVVHDSSAITSLFQPGRYYLGVMTDALGSVTESNDSNNTAVSGSFNIAPDAPDLVISSLTAPSVANSGQQIDVNWTVRNAGMHSTEAWPWSDAIYLCPTSTFDSSAEYRLSSFTNVNALPAGDQYSNTQKATIPNGISGTYYLFVKTDDAGAVREISEGNNHNAVLHSVAITLSPSPDLQVSAMTLPGAISSGDSIPVIFTVTNTGVAATTAGPWVDNLYISPGSTFDQSTATLLAMRERNTVLGAGASYTESLRVALPRAAYGKQYFYLITDASNAVYEYQAEENNIRRSDAIDIALTPPPDLAVTSITVPLRASAGRLLELSWSVSNQGSGPAPETRWNDRVYLSKQGVFHPESVLVLGTFEHTGILAAGASYGQTQAVRLPDEISGLYYIFVRTDWEESVFEHGDTVNNLRRTDTVFAITPRPWPDLTIDSFHVNGNVSSDGVVHFSYLVVNHGDTAITVPNWAVGIYLQRDSIFSEDLQIAYNVHTDQIAPGGNLAITDSAVIPSSYTAGRYFLGAAADPISQVIETNESNNTAVSTGFTYAADGPDLVVSTVAAPPTAFSGTSIAVTWVIRNQGTIATSTPTWHDVVYLSPGATFDSAGSIRLGTFENVSYLGVGQSYSNTQQVLLPKGIDGTYHVVVAADETHNVRETVEDNNRTVSDTVAIALSPSPDLRVASLILPDHAFSGDSITVTYTITNRGNGSTESARWNDDLFFSQDSIFDAKTAKKIYAGSNAGLLAPESSYTISARVKLPYALYGPSYLFLATDYNNNVYEYTAETNNTLRAGPLDVTLTPPPDLGVTHVSSPTTGASSGLVQVIWTVQNQGFNAPEEYGWVDRVYTSRYETFAAESSYAIGTFSHYGRLDPESTYVRTEKVRLPDGAAGMYFIFVKTDGDDQVFENGAKTNNIRRADSAISISLSPWADLGITNFSVPFNLAAGQQAQVSFTVRNGGLGIAGGSSWADMIYASPHSSIDSYAKPLKFVMHEQPLGPSEEYTVTATVEVPVDLPDTAWFFVVTDGGNSIYEHGSEMNNTESSGPRAILALPSCDLAVDQFSAPPGGTSGSPASLRWTVSNIGNGAALPTELYDAIYLVPDSIFRAEDRILVAAIPRVERVEPSLSYSRQLSVPLPDGVSGRYYIMAVSDSGKTSNDRDYRNNLRFAPEPINIALAPAPDLRITALDAPAAMQSGSLVTVRWTVENSSDTPTRDTTWSDALFLSTNRALDKGDLRLAGTFHQGRIEAWGTYNDSVQFVVPAYISGDLYLIAKTDSRPDIYEGAAGELNNLFIRDVLVSSALPSDLVIGPITAPDSVTAGGEALVSWTLRNNGPNPAQGYLTEAVYVSTDSLWDVHDALLGTIQHSVDLPAGGLMPSKIRVNLAQAVTADSLGNVTAPFPGIAPGRYYILVRTDMKNVIPETDETNNIGMAEHQTSVTLPELKLGIVASGSLLNHQSQFFRIDSVPAGEALRVRLASNNRTASHELYLKYGSVPSRGAFDAAFSSPFSPNQEVFIPQTQAGEYYVMVYGDNVPGDTSAYSIIAELVQFSITSVTPNHGGNTGEVTVTVNGARFAPGATVSLVGKNGNDVKPIQILSATSSKIEATFDLTANVPLGNYDVVVTQPDLAKAILPGAFTVEPGTAFSADLGFVPPASMFRGGSGFYAISMQNTSNVDLPYLAGYIIIPGDQPFTLNSDRVITMDRCLPESLRSLAPLPGAFDVDGWRFIPILATHVRVGEKIGIALQVTRVTGTEFPIQMFAEAYSRHEFIQGQLTMIELYRQALLANPPPMFEASFLQLAQSQVDFTDAMLQQYVAMGLLTQQDIGTVTFGQMEQARRAAAQIPYMSEDALKKHLRGITSMSCKDQVNLVQFGAKLIKATVFIAGEVILAPVTGGATIIIAAYHVVQVAIAAKNLMDGKEGFLVKLICGKDPRTPTPIRASKDPNDLQGPAGFGDKRWVGVTQSLPYTILYENDPKFATAPAQVVKITLPIDSTADIRSFRLGVFGFGLHLFSEASERSSYSARLDMRDSLGIDIDVVAGVDVQKRQAFWTFSSIDPATGLAPVDPDKGFLKVNDSTHAGEGFVTFSMRAKSTVPTGSILTAKAHIVFDINDPLDTPPAINTVDAGIPRSTITGTTRIGSTNDYLIRWRGTDDSTGAGMGKYSLFVSSDDSGYVPFINGTNDTSAVFPAVPGHHYSMMVLAIDNAGNIEPGKTKADATLEVTGVQDLHQGLPHEYGLSQNYPNPFNPQTVIEYALPFASRVTLSIYNVLGQRVTELVASAIQDGGYKRANWNASALSSGVYFYRIDATSVSDPSKRFSLTRKMLLLK